MQWHLERSRIIFAIEHEISHEERGKPSNKYWSVINGKRYLQVMVEDAQHFRRSREERDRVRTRKTSNATYGATTPNDSGNKPSVVLEEDEKKD